ncbi:hypothetical protein A5482_014550 (plasmid) [Cyanobacterium sp. IPPAS B-1200]|uniref:hypothetical protein n=1 Tax=Cyanobacterium sp. IPPAS B-1200 TaxID=1562720 RepID=UPI001373444B|nr:hypothetical protein [Cyanobacterium sp. IPPAS B-1200]
MPSSYKEEKQKVEPLKPLSDKVFEPPPQQKIDFSQKMNNLLPIRGKAREAVI